VRIIACRGLSGDLMPSRIIDDGGDGDQARIFLLPAAATRFANVATIFLSSGSLTNETALLGSTHWTNRCSNSGQALLCVFTSNGKTLTSQLTSMPGSSSNL
jgi:hypothetical protein